MRFDSCDPSMCYYFRLSKTCSNLGRDFIEVGCRSAPGWAMVLESLVRIQFFATMFNAIRNTTC